jgi:hypothetical protein
VFDKGKKVSEDWVLMGLYSEGRLLALPKILE